MVTKGGSAGTAPHLDTTRTLTIGHSLREGNVAVDDFYVKRDSNGVNNI